MVAMKDKKETNNTLFFVSIGLIFFAIILTAIISKVAGTESATDLRAKAGFSTGLKLEGVVKSTDSSSGTFIADNVHFIYKSRKDSEENLGSWVVTPPPGFSLAELRDVQEYIVTLLFKSVSGVEEVIGWGGDEKQYNVLIDIKKLQNIH